MAGDVATAGKAGPDVTRELPTVDGGVTSPPGMPDAQPAGPDDREGQDEADRGAAGQDASAGRTASPEVADDDETAGQDQRDPAQPGLTGRKAPHRNPAGAGKKSAARVAAGRVTRRSDSAGTSPEPQPDGSSGAAAMRRRLARLGVPRGGTVNPVLEPLIRTVRTTHPKADIRKIERAYEVAARLHAGQSRRSGDPYITHPLAVATILAELGMPHDTICAALLHDTVEDTQYTIGQLREDFGEEVAALVDGVTKLDKVKYGDAAQA